MSNPFSLGAQILETPQQGGPKYHELYIRLVVLTGQEFAIPTGPQGTDPINTIVRDLKLSIGVYSGSGVMFGPRSRHVSVVLQDELPEPEPHECAQ